jgi:uncharacterized membrane protein HdeD (DUF308 family)
MQFGGDKTMATMTASSATTGSNMYPWWAVLLQGIFALIIGLLLLTNTAATTVVIVQFIGIYWLVSGIFALVGLFIDRSYWGLKLIAGILGIVAGIAVMQHPWWSSILLPTILVIFLGVDGLIKGVMELIAAFQGGGWGAGILGILSILIGILLLGSPIVAGLALPWVFGVLGIVGGIAAIFMAFQQRRVEESV